MSCFFKSTKNTVGLLVQMIDHKILLKIGVLYVLWESDNIVEMVILLAKLKTDKHIDVKSDMDKFDC